MIMSQSSIGGGLSTSRLPWRRRIGRRGWSPGAGWGWVWKGGAGAADSTTDGTAKGFHEPSCTSSAWTPAPSHAPSKRGQSSGGGGSAGNILRGITPRSQKQGATWYPCAAWATRWWLRL